jgi:DNA (cytosine-5)-methyltransferase 1
MNLSSLNKIELLNKCRELKINNYSSKKKSELINIITSHLIKNPINNETLNENLKFIDLFCGIGGFHQAMKKFNYECVFACDIDKNCRYIYKKNYNLEPEDDIINVDENKIPDFDILCAGFPCQAFSNAGKKKSFEDKRGNLFEHILRIANKKKPSFMFLENVKHIKKIDNGNVFKHIIKRINEIGYTIDEKNVFELSPHQLGVPQHRERVIFVCIRNDIFIPEKKIEIIPPCPQINLDIIIEKDNTDKYKISSEIENILNVWDIMIQKFEVNESLSPTILCNEFYNNYTDNEFEKLPEWKKDYITKNKPLYEKYQDSWDEWYEKNNTILQKKEIYAKLEWQVGKKKKDDSIWNYFIQLRQSGIRVKKCDYFPTLVAIVQTPIYAKEKRYITPRECARLQSFPDDFIIHENDHIAYKQFGNAVNVNVIHFVVENVLKTYNII